MHKTERLIVLVEPDLLKRVKKAAKNGSRTVSDLVRGSLLSYLRTQAASRRTRKLSKIGQYSMPLRGIENVSRLKRTLEQKYSDV